jgi:hypothetical protein
MLIRGMIVVTSLSLAVILLPIGLAARGLSRGGKNGDLPKIGVLELAFSLAAAIAVTAVAFGLAPSRIIPAEAQAWILTGLVIATPLALISWIAWGWLARRAFKFSLRAMLILVSVLCVLLGLISITDPHYESFTSLPFALSIPARGWDQLDAASLENLLRPAGIWVWATLQWTAYYGHYLTIAIWALFAALLFRFKLHRAAVAAGEQALSFRDQVAAFSRSWGMASLQLSALLLVLHLALMPEIVAAVEQEMQQKLAFARQPSAHWSEVEQAVQRVRSDPQRMDSLRGAAEAEMSQETSSEPGS